MKVVNPIAATTLEKNLQGQGQHIHDVSADGYLTLYMSKVYDRDVEPVGNGGHSRAVMYVGRRGIAFNIVPKEGEVLVNFPVWYGEEIWMGIDPENTYIVHGMVTSEPFGFYKK